MAGADQYMPSAPPSYDESMASKQPAYNPAMVGAAPVQAGYPGTVGYSPVPQMPPPQASYVIQHQAPQMAYVGSPAPAVVIPIALGPRPARVTCPQCQKQVTTRISSDSQTSAHIAAFVLCLLGCYLCCCIPYCMDSFKNVHHNCPNCRAFLGTYKH